MKSLAQEAEKKGQLYVFIIVDKKDEKSILNMHSTKVEYDGQGRFKGIRHAHYLEDFPFRNYIIL